MGQTKRQPRSGKARALPKWISELLARPDIEVGRYVEQIMQRIAARVEPRGGLFRALALRRLRSEYLDAAVSEEGSKEHLAIALALAGDYERAGRAFRAHVQPRMLAAQASDLRERARVAKMTVTKLTRQIANERRWHSAGLKIRQREGWPQSDTALAEAIAKKGDNVTTIRLLLPAMELDARTWRNRVKAGKKKLAAKKTTRFRRFRK